MARITEKSTDSTITKNHEGTKAFVLPDKAKLMTMVATSFFNEAKFYGDNSAEMVALAEAIVKKEPQFIQKLAVYTRLVLNMRTVTQVLMAVLAKQCTNSRDSRLAQDAIKAFAVRPDDLTNMVAYYINTYHPETTTVDGRKKHKPTLPKCMKKGAIKAFEGFDEYQLAKYDGEGETVSLRHLFRMIHPPAKEGTERYALYNRLLTKKMAIPETWDVELSKPDADKKEAWEKLIANKKVPYMAALKNLRNMLEANTSSEAMDTILGYLTHPKAVEKSRQLPFRYLSAYKELDGIEFSAKAREAVNKAIEMSVDNLPKFTGRTFIMTDNSGSMEAPLAIPKYLENMDDYTERQRRMKKLISRMDVGHLLSAALFKMNPETIIGVFGDRFETYNPRSGDGLLDIVRHLRGMQVGHSTNAYLALDWLMKKNLHVDRVIIVSDMQMYNSKPERYACSYDGHLAPKMQEYRDRINKSVWLHSIDVAGYGTAQFRGNCNLMTGFSEKILKFVKMVEVGEGSMLEEIERYEVVCPKQ